MTQKKNKEVVIEATAQSAFILEDSNFTTSRRGIPGATELSMKSNEMAQELLKKVSAESSLVPLADKVCDLGEYSDLIELINQAYTPDELKLEVLSSCNDDELGRLLESRRSDRSKAKHAGLRRMSPLLRYLSAGIAEIMIRTAMGKAYGGSVSSGGITSDPKELKANQDLLNRKIRSLQSKCSVLKRQGEFAPETWVGWEELEKTKAQLDELISLRVSASGQTTRPVNKEQVKSGLKAMSPEELKALIAEAQRLANIATTEETEQD